MSKIKKLTFDAGIKQRARLFKALAHPARLTIMEYLAEIKTCITGDIAEELPLSRTTVNQHLKELKTAGLIKGTVEGVKTKYCINEKAIRDFKLEINDFLKKMDININCE